MLHARVIDVLLCMSNGRPERADGRVNRRAVSHTAGWTCPREGMFTPCCYLHAFGTCSGCLATCMFTHQSYLHALGNRRGAAKPCCWSGRMDVWMGRRTVRQPGGRAPARACARYAATCTQLAIAIDALRCACSQNYIICMHLATVDGLLGQPELADSRARLTCVREGIFTPCYYLHAFGTCSRCVATCMFAKLFYLHALGNCRRTAKAAGAVGWTRGRADGQPDSRVDVLPRGHVHAMLLFARIWHLQ